MAQCCANGRDRNRTCGLCRVSESGGYLAWIYAQLASSSGRNVDREKPRLSAVSRSPVAPMWPSSDSLGARSPPGRRAHSCSHSSILALGARAKQRHRMGPPLFGSHSGLWRRCSSSSWGGWLLLVTVTYCISAPSSRSERLCSLCGRGIRSPSLGSIRLLCCAFERTPQTFVPRGKHGDSPAIDDVASRRTLLYLGQADGMALSTTTLSSAPSTFRS